MNEYDWEYLEHLFENVNEGELDPEEGVSAFRRHLASEHGSLDMSEHYLEIARSTC
jgi:hypothetical protein